VRAQPAEIDAFLAAALRGESAGWPADWDSEGGADAVVERIAYHGIATLLNERSAMLENWPTAVREQIRKTALAQSMWELRHALVIGTLLEGLTNAGVPHLLLKGSAIAYDLYQNPAARERGDTDLLVPKDKRDAAREILNESGFRREIEDQDLPEALRSQEPWSFTSEDASIHSIDLHWQPLNTPALDARLTFDEMAMGCRALPRLSGAAIAPSRLMMLLHACLHRGLHDCSPYFVGGRTYFGGNRLIWLYDLVLLGRVMSEAEWREFCRMAVEKRMAAVCLDGLAAAESFFGFFCPDSVREALGSAKPGSYFSSGQFGRALQDVFAVPGMQRKWQYLWARAVPTRDFVRAKYPEMEASPLAALYLRRFVELLRERPGGSG
jgi:hypothetical protein